jgi:tetratricopeptide (TPR) repeat protein
MRPTGADEMASRLREMHLASWRRAAGDLLPALLRSAGEAEGLLTHADAAVRRVAIEVLARHWNAISPGPLRTRLEEIAFADPDLGVRTSALSAVTWSYRESGDARLGALLAIVLCDESMPLEFRRIAYIGLLSLRPISCLVRFNPFARPQVRVRIPEDVNWRYVDAFLDRRIVAPPANAFDAVPEPRRDFYRSCYLGISAHVAGMHAEAVAHLTAALRHLPNAAGLLYRRGCSNLSAGNVDASIEDLSRSVDILPNSPASYSRRAEAYERKGLLGLSKQDVESAARLERDAAESSRSLDERWRRAMGVYRL